MALSADIQLSVSGRHTGAADLGTPVFPFVLTNPITLTDGTGASQADRVFSDSRTLAASASEDLDLAGGVTDTFGNTITFAKIKAIAVKAAADNTNNVNVSRPAANGVPLFLAAGDGLGVPAGGAFAHAWPGAGVVVTGGTADLLTVANGGAGTPVTYEIVIIGTSA